MSILEKIGQKNVFAIFLKEETPFKIIKTRNSKTRKTGILPKGLVYGFRQKLEIFPDFD